MARQEGANTAVASHSLVLGISGPPTGICRWQGVGQLEHLAKSREGFSVYGVALSPDRSRAAGATKSPGDKVGRGYVEVWTLDVEDHAPRPTGSYALPFPAYSVAWLTDHLLAVGTVENRNGSLGGVCALFNIDHNNGLKPVGSTRPDGFRHPGAITLVESIGQDCLLTVCSTGVARIWNTRTGDLEGEFVDGSTAANLPLLPTAMVLPDGESLIVQFPSAEVRLLRRDGDGWQSGPLAGCVSPIGGFCCLGETLLVGNWGDAKARVIRVGSWELLGTVNLLRPFRALLAVGPGVIAVHHLDFSVAVWRIEPKLECLERLPIQSVRRIASGASAGYLAKNVADSRMRDEQTRLAALTDAICSAQNLIDIRARIEEAVATGYGFEGLVLLAQWCRQQGNPLAELQVRTEMCRELPNVPESALHLRIYGELLEALGEPQRALAALIRSKACDPLGTDVDGQIARLEALRTPDEGEQTLYVIPAPDGPGNACDRVRECVLRDLAAGRQQPRRYAIRSKSSVPLVRTKEGRIDLAILAGQLSDRVGHVAPEELTLVFETGESHACATLRYEPEVQQGAADLSVRFFCEFIYAGPMVEYNLYVSAQRSTDKPAGDDSEPNLYLAPWVILRAELSNHHSTLEKRCEFFEVEIKKLVPRLLSAGQSPKPVESTDVAQQKKAAGAKSGKPQKGRRVGKNDPTTKKTFL